MLVGQRSRLHEIIFYIRHYVGLPFAVLLAFDILVASLYLNLGWTWIALPHIPLSLFGSAIGVMVAFRLSGAYARWWEARQLWGAVVNDSRTLARQALSFLKGPEHKTRIVHLQIAYINALRLQLRNQNVVELMQPWLEPKELSELSSQKNMALAIQNQISLELASARTQDRVSDYNWMQIDETLARLMNSQGGLERIKSTPMPKQYSRLLTLFIGVYSMLLPFGLIQNLEIMTPIGSSALAIIFLTLNKIGAEIEHPFENRPSDVSMTAITRTIEIGLRQLLGESKIPGPLTPEDGVLW